MNSSLAQPALRPRLPDLRVPSSACVCPPVPSAGGCFAPVCLNPDRIKSAPQSYARWPHVIRTTPITKCLARQPRLHRPRQPSAPARQVNSPAHTNRLASLNINIHSRTVVKMVNPRDGVFTTPGKASVAVGRLASLRQALPCSTFI